MTPATLSRPACSALPSAPLPPVSRPRPARATYYDRVPVYGRPVYREPVYRERLYREGPVRGTYARTYATGLEPWSPQWYDYCESRYRSFNPRTGTFTGYDGVRRFCAGY